MAIYKVAIRTTSARIIFTIFTTNTFCHMTNRAACTRIIFTYCATSAIYKMAFRATDTRIFMTIFTATTFF